MSAVSSELSKHISPSVTVFASSRYNIGLVVPNEQKYAGMLTLRELMYLARHYTTAMQIFQFQSYRCMHALGSIRR